MTEAANLMSMEATDERRTRERIGRYELLGELGSGGMGRVLAAHDPELDRTVAIKVLRADRRLTPLRRARLVREAQAMARLAHPNVVSVYDVGSHEGSLFVAMEHIDGVDLRVWLERARGLDEIVSMFIGAGRGLAAAHEAGLIHRDFKPDNVLVGHDGRPRVTDFGLVRDARFDETDAAEDSLETRPSTGKFSVHAGPVDEITDVGSGDHGGTIRPSSSTTSSSTASSPWTRVTRVGAFVGTPAYMAPEQFSGDAIDERTDQFAFCVALYEALCGERPFPGTTAEVVAKNVLLGHRRPRSSSAVPAWIHAIIDRGLARDPNDRWPSMEALLEELTGDPIARRRRWWIVAAALVLLGAGASWGLSSAGGDPTCADMNDRLAGVWDESRRAEVEVALVSTELGYAAETWRRVEHELDDYTERWVAARVDACEATQRGEQSTHLLDLRMACLDEKLYHVRATVDVLVDASDAVVEDAIQTVAGLPRLEPCADARALIAAIPPPDDPEVARRVGVQEQRLVEAEVLELAGSYAEGLELASAVVSEAAELGYEPLLVRAWLRQGHLYFDLGEYEAAEAALEQTYESAIGLQMMAEAAAASAKLTRVVGESLGRHEDGRRWAENAKPLARAVSTDQPEFLAEHLDNLGILERAEGRYEDAREHHQQALEIYERILGSNHPRLAKTLLNIGLVAQDMGEYEDARAHFLRAQEFVGQVLGPGHPDVAKVSSNLGIVANAQGDYEGARRHYEHALAILEQSLGPDHSSVGKALTNLGNTAFRVGDLERAYELLNRSLTIFEAAHGPNHPLVAGSLSNIGNVLDAEGKLDEGRSYQERALAIYEDTLGPEHPKVAKTLNNLGTNAFKQGKLDDARELQERALAIREKTLGAQHPNLAISALNLGILAFELGDLDGARAHYERALAIHETTLGLTHPFVARSLEGLGDLERAQGNVDVAIAKFERALAINEASDPSSTTTASTQFKLARVLWETARGDNCVRHRAHELANRARDIYADAGERTRAELEEVKAWQAQTVARRRIAALPLGERDACG